MFYETIHIFGPINIAPYGMMVALGLLAAIVGGGRENERIRLMTAELFEKVALWAVIWGLIGARMFYVFTQLDDFMADPAMIPAIWKGGLVFYGGPIGSIFYLVYHFVLRKKGPKPEGEYSTVQTFKDGWQRLLRFFDLGAPMLAVAHAFGRLGCVCAGCCYGTVHDGLLSLHYPEGSPAYALGGAGRYPIPLVEAGIELALFALLMQLRLKKRFHGQVMLTYVMIYPAARFVLEMFRGDTVRGYVLELDTPGLATALGLESPIMMTTSQFISVVVVTTAIALIFVGKRASADGPIPEFVWEDDAEDEEDDDEEEGDEEEGDEDEDDGDEDSAAEAANADADAEDEKADAEDEKADAEDEKAEPEKADSEQADADSKKADSENADADAD